MARHSDRTDSASCVELWIYFNTVNKLSGEKQPSTWTPTRITRSNTDEAKGRMRNASITTLKGRTQK
jgi:hypothetical protein